MTNLERELADELRNLQGKSIVPLLMRLIIRIAIKYLVTIAIVKKFLQDFTIWWREMACSPIYVL